jgi:transmembrane sensor
MSAINRDRFRISEEAALWLIRLERDGSAECQAEFAAWSRRSPLHVEEFLFATATWRHLQPVDPERCIDLATLDAAADANAVLPIGDRAGVSPAMATEWASLGRSKRRHTLRLAAALAAGVLVTVAIFWIAGWGGDRTYATAPGDQLAVKLPDGSVLHLNTDSKAKVSFDEHSRTVRLLEGEALFMVERDASRPFEVIAANAKIQAVGTQFNVYRRSDGTRVSVVEGAVRITSQQTSRAGGVKLGAGDEANVAAGKIVKAMRPNVQRAVAWRARRLVFQSDRLEDVAREFNRYETRRPIRIEGMQLGDRVVSGVFDADDPRPLVEFLRDDPALSVTESERQILVRER